MTERQRVDVSPLKAARLRRGLLEGLDVVIRTAKLLALLGDVGYDLALWLNRPLNWTRYGWRIGGVFDPIFRMVRRHGDQDGRDMVG